MSGLIGNLLNSSHALTTQSGALKTTGRNLANVNNANYARETVVTESQSGPGGALYETSRIESARDAVLDRGVTNEIGATASLEELQRLQDTLNSIMGESVNKSLGTALKTASEANSGITGELSSFFNSWQELASSPNSASAKAALLANAQQLASTLNSADAALDEAADDIDSRLVDQVDEANRLLEQIATLNQQIVAAEAREPGSSASLRDSRQGAIEGLAAITDFSTDYQPDGSVTLSIGGGATPQLLVDAGNAGKFSINRNNGNVPIGLTARLGGQANTVVPAKGSLSVLHPSKGLAEVAGMRSELDALAAQLTASVNEAYSPAGQGDFFSGTTAGTIAVVPTEAGAISPSAAADASGSNAVATAISALSTQAFDPAAGAFISGTFGDYTTQTATNHARDLAQTQGALADQKEVESLVRTRRDNNSGVSMDEEMTDMIRFQKAFQASARIVDTLNSLLELVTTRLGG